MKHAQSAILNWVVLTVSALATGTAGPRLELGGVVVGRQRARARLRENMVDRIRGSPVVFVAPGRCERTVFRARGAPAGHP